MPLFGSAMAGAFGMSGGFFGKSEQEKNADLACGREISKEVKKEVCTDMCKIVHVPEKPAPKEES